MYRNRIKGSIKDAYTSVRMKPAQEESKAKIIPTLDNTTPYPTMPEAETKVPFDEPIGFRVPGKSSSNGRNGSVERSKRATNAVAFKKEEREEASMEEEIVELFPPAAANDGKKKKQKKKKKKNSAVLIEATDDDPTLSNEAKHFRTFARKHFTIILRRMGKLL